MKVLAIRKNVQVSKGKRKITLRKDNLIIEFLHAEFSLISDLAGGNPPLQKAYSEKESQLLSLLIQKRLLRVIIRKRKKDIFSVVPYNLEALLALSSESPRISRRLSKDVLLRTTATGGWELLGVKEQGHIEDLPPSIIKSMADRGKELPDEEWVHSLGSLGFFAQPRYPEYWQIHDLLFHKNSSSHEAMTRTGATFKGRNVYRLPPAYKTYRGKGVSLLPPGPSGNLSVLLSRRRSQRDFSSKKIPFRKVSELLSRMGEVHLKKKTHYGEFLWKSYPSGGALHEEEFYLVVNSCEGLEEGIYHFNQLKRKLVRIKVSDSELREFFLSVPPAIKATALPGALLVVTATMGRRYWKYEGIALRNSLLNAGVILDQLYLHGTELGLKVCAIGGADQSKFARLLGQEPQMEPITAMVALGT